MSASAPSVIRLMLWCVAFTLCLEGGLRALYHDELAELGAAVEARAGGEAEDEAALARWSVQARNAAKADIRRWDLDALRLSAEASNQARYGDPLGPRYEQLRAERSDAEILDAATRANASVDALVLGFAGLGLGLALLLAFTAPRRGYVEALSALSAALLGWLGARALGYALGELAAGLSLGLAVAFAALGALLGVALAALLVRHALTRRDAHTPT